MSKRRFEFIDGGSSKFWELELAGTELHIAWGKIGAAGQSQTKSFATASKAEAAAQKLVTDKTGKGYAEVTASPEKARAEKAKATAAEAPSPPNDAPLALAMSPLPPRVIRTPPASRPTFDAKALYASIRKAVVNQKLSDYPHLGPVLAAFATPQLPESFDLAALTFLDYGYWDEKAQRQVDVLPWAFELAFALGGPRATIEAFFRRWQREEVIGDFWPHYEPALLARLPQADLDAMHAIAKEQMAGKSLRQRLAVAYLFEDAPLLRALVPELLQSSLAGWSILVVPLLRDLELLDQLVEHFWPKHQREVARALGNPMFQAQLGVAAGRYYALRFREAPHKYLVSEAVGAASPEAARFLAAHLDHKLVTKAASKFFSDHRDLARAALPPVAQGPSKAAALAQALSLQLGIAPKVPAPVAQKAVPSADDSELPEWWAKPRWLTVTPEKPKRKGAAEAIALTPVHVPFVMDEALRSTALSVQAIYPLSQVLPTEGPPVVVLGEVASLPVSPAALAKFGSRPFWFFASDREGQSTVFDVHPEPDVSGPEVDELMSFLGEQSRDSSYAIRGHIGAADAVQFAFHTGIDVARAQAAFEADGFRVYRTAWPLPKAVTLQPTPVVRPEGDGHFSALLVDPRNRVYRGWLTQIVEHGNGSSTHTSVGSLVAIFDTLSDDALLDILPRLPAGSGDATTARYLAARFGGDAARAEVALPAAARLGRVDALEEFAATGVAASALAPSFAKLLHGKRPPAFAKRWLAQHLEHAVAGLVPAALSADGEAALAGLRFLAGTHRAEVLRLASLHGRAAAAAIEVALSRDAFDDVPKKVPALPAFAHPSLHPPLVLRASGHALAESAVTSLLTMLAFSRADAPYAGVLAARELLEPRSADAFAWSLFSQWEAGGRDGNDWVLLAVGHLGGDDCARKLTPRIRAWPGESAHAAAVKGLDALAAIGSDIALMYLHGIAQKLKFKGLQEKARQKIEELAEARGLSAAELADRLVPDLDLDADGSRVLDFGARSFRVVFDETLKPHLKDESGKLLSDLPKPNKSDDAAKAKEATEVWKALKADSKAIAQQEVLRLEQIMCMQRRIEPQAFFTFFVEHPLVSHLTKRLIWGAYREGALLSCFRVTEDRSYADADDAPFVVPDGAMVGLVHRLELPKDAGAKLGQILGDYELLQPFDQLSRATYVVSEAEKAQSSLTRPMFKTKLGKLLGLEHRGWRKGPAEDAGWVWRMEKTLPDGVVVELPLGTGANDGGICMGWMEGTPAEQAITGFSLRRHRDPAPVTLERVSPILVSELLRDLELLRE